MAKSKFQQKKKLSFTEEIANQYKCIPGAGQYQEVNFRKIYSPTRKFH